MKYPCLIGGVLLCVAAAPAPAPAPASITAITGGMVFDGLGHDPVQETILIQGDRITAVGPDIEVPAGAHVIDVHGMAVTPGFYDLHTHWTAAGQPTDLPSIARAYLASGVTTVNDFNEETEAYAPLRDWLSHIPSPHVNYAARIGTWAGHGADWSDQGTTRWVGSPESARAAIDAVEAYHPDLVKVFHDGWRYGMMPDNNTVNEQTLAAIVEETHKYGQKVFTHTVTVQRGLEAAQAKVDSLAHGVQDRPLTEDDIAAIKASGMGEVATLAVYDPAKSFTDGKVPPQREKKFEIALKNVDKLFHAGVPIGVGTDAGMPKTPHGISTLHELELLVRAGLTPAEALTAATHESAVLINEDADRGSIAVGKRADIAVFDGKPWDEISDIHHVAMTMVDGRPVFGLDTPERPLSADALTPIKAKKLIDNFESADGRSSLDTLRKDSVEWGEDRSREVSAVIPDENGKGHILSVNAQMAFEKDPYGGVAIPLTRGSIQPVDVTGFHGVSFRFRGSACPASLVVTGTLDAQWSAPATISSRWQVVKVPFSALKPIESKQSKPWTGTDVTEVELRGSCPHGETLWLEADDVQFY